MKTTFLAAGLCLAAVAARAADSPDTVTVAALETEMTTFVERELAAHLAAIPRLDPPPDRVHGALTTGEFSWGSFMRALSEYYRLTGKVTLADRDLPKWVGQIGLIEARGAGKEFSQLYGAMALHAFGRDLAKNPVWQSLSEPERQEWRNLLDPSRFYDAKTKKVLSNENYLGVALRIVAISHAIGLNPDRASVDALLDRALEQFRAGQIYFDDQPPVGRYDRYSNEYVRYLWFAAKTAGREDAFDVLRPSLKTQMRLWWDLVAEDGYGFTWGRSLGLIGYLDTMEIVAFLAENPEFRPAPLPDLVAAFHAAWRWTRADFDDKRHLFSIFAFGRGNYMYINPEREFQQTATGLAKIVAATRELFTSVRGEKLESFPAKPNLAPVARFEWFRKGDRPSGVWAVRQGHLQFALPIVTGTFSGGADYLPAPHGLPGFGAPVEQPYPSLVPFVEIEGGPTVVAGDGADAIEPAADGRSVTARWRRWAVAADAPKPTKDYLKKLELVEPGLESTVRFRVDGGRFIREETLTVARPVRVKRLWMAVPVQHDRYRIEAQGRATAHVFAGQTGELSVTVSEASWPVATALRAMEDSPLGRGDRGGLPLHLVLEGRDLTVTPQQPLRWTVVLEPRRLTAQ